MIGIMRKLLTTIWDTSLTCQLFQTRYSCEISCHGLLNDLGVEFPNGGILTLRRGTDVDFVQFVMWFMDEYFGRMAIAISGLRFANEEVRIKT